MAKPLFFVDLSEDARDYRHTALEPGLPLLDRQGVNFQILRQWLGDYAAEPEWRNQDTIGFYMVDDERGRLEDVDCHPASRGEMEKLFAKDLEAIRAKIKKAKPESSTEQMVHRILKKSIAEQTNDLDTSDFDSFFFKCRAGREDWRLVWCCGYQRADLEPLKAKLWNTPDGEFLGVRPPLQGGRAKRRKRTGPLDALTSPWLVLALVLLLAAFLYFSWPRLEVTPAAWAGPLGSQIEYRLQDHRWFFFDRDVTLQALAQSNDPRVVEFAAGGVAHTKSIGSTSIWFRVGNRPPVEAQVVVVPPEIPDTLTIEPADQVTVPIGSTRRLKAIGHYPGGKQVDLSRLVSWWEADSKRLLVMHQNDKGLIEGDSSGETTVVAQFPMPRDDQTFVEATLGVHVVVAEFTSLAVSLQPAKFAVGQSSRVEVTGIDREGSRHALTGSSLLKLRVDPNNLARLEGGYLVGRAEGSGELKASYGDLDRSVAFNISGRALGDDIFLVSPPQVDNAVVYELVPVNVATGNDLPIEAVSASPGIVEVFRTESENAGYEVWLAARRAGEAEVRVSQGDKSRTIKVVVTDGLIGELEFQPPVYALKTGEAKEANLVATTTDGRRIKVVPDALNWERQPRVENVYLDKQTLLLRGLEPTEIPQPLRVTLGSTLLTADATVEVAEGDLLALLDLENGFGVHPPVPVRGRYVDAGSYIGSDVLRYDDTRGLILDALVDPFSPLASIPRGAQLVEWNGVSLERMSPAELAAYFRAHRMGEGDVVRYRGPGGVLGTVLLGSEQMGAVRDFRLLNVLSTNVTAESFDADLRMYLRQPGEYRLTDSASAPLSEWVRYPQDATPLISIAGIARNADDDYDLYVERRIGDQVRRFQVTFTLEPERAPAVVETLENRPTVVDAPDAQRVIVDDPDGDRTKIRRTIKTIRRPAATDGSSVAGPSDDSLAASPNAPGSAAPNSSPPAPASPVPAPGTPSPAPGTPSPAPGTPAPAPASPAPAPGTPSPAPPQPADPNAKPAPPARTPGSDTPPPSAYPAAVAAPDARPQGAATPAGAMAAPGATGAATPGKVAGQTTTSREASRSADDRAKGSPLLDALKNYNREGR